MVVNVLLKRLTYHERTRPIHLTRSQWGRPKSQKSPSTGVRGRFVQLVVLTVMVAGQYVYRNTDSRGAKSRVQVEQVRRHVTTLTKGSWE